MAKLDPQWAISEINNFMYITEQVVPPSTSDMVYLGTVMRGHKADAAEAAHVVEKILDRVLPGWRGDRPAQDEEYEWLQDRAARARAQLLRSDELTEKLGDNAPEMDAGNLHPWAWKDGASLWNTSHYHDAVMKASIRVKRGDAIQARPNGHRGDGAVQRGVLP